MKVDAATKKAYFTAAGEREPALRELDAIIQQNAPHLAPTYMRTPTMTMLAYGMMPYQTKSMKEPGEWPLIALAVQKNHLAMYVCAVEKDGSYVAENLQANLGKVSCGKSCIRFKKLEDLNLDTVRTMLRDLDARYESGEQLYGE